MRYGYSQVSEAMNRAARAADKVGLKDPSHTWEIFPGSPTHNRRWVLKCNTLMGPRDLPFLERGDIGNSAYEAWWLLSHIARLMETVHQLQEEIDGDH